jgi:hypothetical protein
MVYYIKVIRQFGRFYGQFADEGDNTVNKPKIYNVNGVIGCRSVYNTRQQEVCWKSLVWCYIFFSRGIPIDRARHKEKGQPLCMEQYYRLFTNYRIPGVTKDSLISNNTRLMPEPEHIIVICKNQVCVLFVGLNT